MQIYKAFNTLVTIKMQNMTLEDDIIIIMSCQKKYDQERP